MAFQPTKLGEIKTGLLQEFAPAILTEEEELAELQRLLLEANEISDSEDELDDNNNPDEY